jgi:ubiquinone biosynthesis protein
VKWFRPNHLLGNISRINAIIQILIKYGFGYFVDRAELGRNLPFLSLLKNKNAKFFNLPLPVRIRKVIEELGPAFIKLGQLLSTRADLIPIALCHELEKLQDETPVVPFSEIENLMDEEWGKPYTEIFESFEAKCHASASVAQVHLARLKSGEEVVVKILKPGIREIIQRDLEILEYLANLVERYFKESIPSSPVDIVAQLKKAIMREIDFHKESVSIRSFAKDNERDPDVIIPKVYEEYTTRGILVMERIKGYKITDLEMFHRKKWDTRKIARNLSRAVFRQIFLHRSFHADPHPGNILVSMEGKIAFVDFGLTGRINEEMRRLFVRIVQAVIMKDMSSLMHNLKKLVVFERNIDELEFQNDMERLILEYYSTTLSDIRLDRLFEEIFDLTAQYELKISANLFLLMKCMITLEAVVRKLDPSFVIVKEVKFYLKNFMAEEYSPLTIMNNARRFLSSFSDLMNEAPERMSDIMRKASHGSLKIQFELLGVDWIIANLYRIINRLVYSVIAAALLVGSFFLLDSGIAPILFGYPLFSLIGFLLAFLLLLLVFLDILIHKVREHR